MADTTTRADAPAAVRTQRADYGEPTGWVGWNVFAATVMMILGSLHVIWGLVAVVNDDWVVWGNQASLYVDLSVWGWVHLGAGVVVFIAGLGVLVGNVLARAVGVALAAVSLVANFLSLPAYPIWSIAMMTLAVLVIWALTVHGHEMRAPSR
jgi:hypothetical protein